METKNDNVVFIQRKNLAKRKIFFGVFLGLFLFLFFFLLLYFLPIFAVRDIEVSGSSPEIEVAVQQQLLNSLQGVSVIRVNEGMVLNSLQTFPLVNRVSISFDLPDVLKVVLYERSPLAVVYVGDELAVVDVEGKVLEVVSSRDAVALPLIDSFEPVYFNLMTEVLLSLPNDFLHRVDRVEMSSVTTVKLFLRDGSEVIWGDSSNSDLKAQILDILVNQMRDRVEISVYDVSTPNAPVTK